LQVSDKNLAKGSRGEMGGLIFYHDKEKWVVQTRIGLGRQDRGKINPRTKVSFLAGKGTCFLERRTRRNHFEGKEEKDIRNRGRQCSFWWGKTFTMKRLDEKQTRLRIKVKTNIEEAAAEFSSGRCRFKNAESLGSGNRLRGGEKKGTPENKREKTEGGHHRTFSEEKKVTYSRN